jgi:hypothetical protein
MKKNQLEKSIITGKLPLSFLEFINHYFIVFICFAGPLALIGKNTFTGSEPIRNVIALSIIPGILGIIFTWLQSKRLYFEQLKTQLNHNELNRIIDEVADQLEWYIQIRTENYLIARTHPSHWSYSWGERITILFSQDRILVNSICDPKKRPSIVSFGRNHKNVSTLLKRIEKAEANIAHNPQRLMR